MGKLYLLLLYLAICLIQVLRIQAEATTYTTPDSFFYLEVAESLQEGKGLMMPETYPFDENTPRHYLNLWPAAYPVLIAVLSSLTSFSLLPASKLVNMLFLGLIFLLFYRRLGERAWFPALYFCSFGMLEVFSYTWAEGPFLFFVLYVLFLLSRSLEGEKVSFLFVEYAFCLTGLFVFRYAGLFYFLMVSVFLLYFLKEKNYRMAKHLLAGLLIASLFVLGYAAVNYMETGTLFGVRAYGAIEYDTFLWQLLQGIMNEMFIIRNYYFTGYMDYLFLFLLLTQLIVAFFLFSRRGLLAGPFISSRSSESVLIWGGFFYLAFVILLSSLTWFDRFNYRILAPFSAPVFLGLFVAITSERNEIFFQKTYRWVTAFMLLSLLMNSPKHYLLKEMGIQF